MPDNPIDTLKKKIAAGESLPPHVQRAVESKLVDALSNPALYRTVWTGLLECLPDAGITQDDNTATCMAMEALFGLSVSQSGAEVHRRGPSDAPVAVLILGYGGASMNSLSPVDKVYQRLRPSWRTVLSTITGMRSAGALAVVDAQLDQVAAAVAGCSRLVVHAMSNNGYAHWIKLAQRSPALLERLSGCVFDCGMASGGALTAESWYHVLSKTTCGVMALADLKPPGQTLGQAAKRVDAASRATARRMAAGALNDAFESFRTWQLAHEPPVSTLCLTSPTDPVVPMAGVEAFAAGLRAAQPSRGFELIALEAAHCQLAQQQPAAYAAAIEALVLRAESQRLPVPPPPPLPKPPAALAALPKVDEDAPPATPLTTDLLAAVPPDVSDDAAAAPVAESRAAAASSAPAEAAATMQTIVAGLDATDATLSALAEALSLEEAMRVLREDGRPALLTLLKEEGVSRLPLRQALANALSRREREAGGVRVA